MEALGYIVLAVVVLFIGFTYYRSRQLEVCVDGCDLTPEPAAPVAEVSAPKKVKKSTKKAK